MSIGEKIKEELSDRMRSLKSRGAGVEIRSVSKSPILTRDRVMSDVVRRTRLIFKTERISPRIASDKPPQGPDDVLPDPQQAKNTDLGRDFKITIISSWIGTEIETNPQRNPRFRIRSVGTGAIWKAVSEEVIADMTAHNTESLAEAIVHGADVIVFGEFAFPPATSVFESTLDEHQFDPFNADDQNTVSEQFINTAQNILDEAKETAKDRGVTGRNPFIFFGSAHCDISRYNAGVVSLDYEDNSEQVIMSDSANPIAGSPTPGGVEISKGPIIHFKRYPAGRLGEMARVPDNSYFRLYEYKFGVACILICSDIIDINQFMAIIDINNNADAIPGNVNRINLVIVPSYTSSEIMVEACRDLSWLARTNVVFINSLGFDENKGRKFPHSTIFYMGMNEDELCKEGIVVNDSQITASDRVSRSYTVRTQIQWNMLRERAERRESTS